MKYAIRSPSDRIAIVLHEVVWILLTRFDLNKHGRSGYMAYLNAFLWKKINDFFYKISLKFITWEKIYENDITSMISSGDGPSAKNEKSGALLMSLK